MANLPITTGEQSVTAVGAVTGTLNTAVLTGNYTIKVRVRGLTQGQRLMLGVQDTANSSAFSDVGTIGPLAVMHFIGVLNPEGDQRHEQWYDVPFAFFGSTNNQLRLFVYRIDSSVTALITGYLQQ